MEGIVDRTTYHRPWVAVAAVVLVGQLLLAGCTDSNRVPTTTSGPDGGLPRLVPGHHGFDVHSIYRSVDRAPWPDFGPLLVYGAPGEGLMGPGPVLFVRVLPSELDYALGFDPGGRDVAIGGRPGRVNSDRGLGVSVGWNRADGGITVVHGIDLTEADVLAAAGIVEEAVAAGDVRPANLPGGVVLRRETKDDQSISTTSRLVYGSGNRGFDLRLLTGNQNRLDGLLLSGAGGAYVNSWRDVTVSGRPGVLFTSEEDGSAGPRQHLVWSERDGVIAELISQGLTGAEMVGAAESLREADEAQWKKLEAKVPPRHPVEHGAAG